MVTWRFPYNCVGLVDGISAHEECQDKSLHERCPMCRDGGWLQKREISAVSC